MKEIKVIKKIDLPQEDKKPTPEARAQKQERDAHRRLDGIGKRLTDQHKRMSDLESRLLEAQAQISQLVAIIKEQGKEILATKDSAYLVQKWTEGLLDEFEDLKSGRADAYRKILDTRLAQLQSYDSTLALMKRIVIGMAVLYVVSILTIIIL